VKRWPFSLLGSRSRPLWQILAVFAYAAGIGLLEALQLHLLGYQFLWLWPLCVVAAMFVPAILYPLWR
jgi:hypothetical protein